MRKLADSKGMYLFLQLLALVCLADAWLVAGGELFRGAVLLWGAGGLLLGLSVVCLFRTARTPYAEECANVLNLVFHGVAAVFFAAAAVRCTGMYHIFPDFGAVRRLFLYDADDGVAYLLSSLGFPASVLGLAACVLLVCMCLTARREAAASESRR